MRLGFQFARATLNMKSIYNGVMGFRYHGRSIKKFKHNR